MIRIHNFHRFESHKIGHKAPHAKGFVSRKIKKTKAQTKHIVMALIVALFMGGLLQNYTGFLSTSVTETARNIQFNGTVAPVKQVPNWVQLTNAERKKTYSQIPSHKFIPLPAYDTTAMRKGTKYEGSTEHQRNTYITYSVPFLGNYNLDGTEYSGSHVGVDIKIPVGTPIYAMANGIVTKVKNQPTGYGYYVTISHPNAPSSQNPNQTTTLYSTYAHLSKQLVKVGQVINKGDLIAYSGQSGFSTAPHLHFQVDTAEAPYAPWWPFTWAEIKAAGYSSFSEAVRKGLNQNMAKKLSVHPFHYIAKTQNGTYNSSRIIVENTPNKKPRSKTLSTQTKVDRPAIQRNSRGSSNMPTITPKRFQQKYTKSTPKKRRTLTPPPSTTKRVVTNAPKRTLASIPNTKPTLPSAPKQTTKPAIVTPPVAQKTVTPKQNPLRTSPRFSLAFDQTTSYVPSRKNVFTVRVSDPDKITQNGITIETTLRGLATIEPAFLTPNHFINGQAKVSVQTQAKSPFKLVASGDFGEVKSPLLKAVLFKDIPTSHPAKKSIESLQIQGIMSGYDDGTFKPDGFMNRAEAITIVVKSQKKNPTKTTVNPFADVKNNAWYAPYVSQAYKDGLLTVAEDKKFRPDEVITRAEFLSLALRSANIPLPKSTSSKYKDVDKNDWYAPYFALNSSQNIMMIRGRQARPISPVSRGDAAITIDKVMRVKVLR